MYFLWWLVLLQPVLYLLGCFHSGSHLGRASSLAFVASPKRFVFWTNFFERTVLFYYLTFDILYTTLLGHSGTMVTHSPPSSEVCGSNPGANVGKLAIAKRWLTVYSTEP